MLIPATTAPIERTHSSLNFVKNDLRSTTLEDPREVVRSLIEQSSRSIPSMLS